MIEELDLAGCLLPSWSAVVPLARELLRLRTLDLSGARLDFGVSGSEDAQDPGAPGRPGFNGRAMAGAAFGALRLLVLNRTGVTWPLVRAHAYARQRRALGCALPCWEVLRESDGARGR